MWEVGVQLSLPLPPSLSLSLKDPFLTMCEFMLDLNDTGEPHGEIVCPESTHLEPFLSVWEILPDLNTRMVRLCTPKAPI